jgi:hypothetical protein
MKTILEEWVELYPMKKTIPVTYQCELTGLEKRCLSISFSERRCLNELFPSISFTSPHVCNLHVASKFLVWYFSEEILSSNQEELKAKIALGLIDIMYLGG